MKTVNPDTPQSRIQDILSADGGVIIEGAAPPEEIAAVTEALSPLLDATPPGDGSFCGRHTRRLAGLVARLPALHALIENRIVLDTMESLLGPHCDRIQLNVTQAIAIDPGEDPQAIHRDDDLYPFPHPGFEIMANCMWAISPFTADNGATLVVPGSHLWLPDWQAIPPESVSAEMAPGSVLIYRGATLHGGGANRSAATRVGIIIGYALGWVRQMENQYLAVPPENARRLPESLQRLIGYQAHRPNLGWVDCRDPQALLTDDPSALKAAEDMFPDGHYEKLAGNTAS